jgi:mRNA interferase MazF
VAAKLDVKRGDIVYVDLRGSEGTEKQGNRPCVVVQNDRGNQFSPLTIIVPITDPGQYKRLPVQVWVTVAELGDWATKDGSIECGHVRTVDRDARISSVIGHLPEHIMQQVDRALSISIGLA